MEKKLWDIAAKCLNENTLDIERIVGDQLKFQKRIAVTPNVLYVPISMPGSSMRNPWVIFVFRDLDIYTETDYNERRKYSKYFRKNLHKPNLPQESKEIDEASDGNCVMVKYKSPCDKGVKEYNVRMTIDELQKFVEKNGNPVDIQDVMTRMAEKGQADFDALAPITFNVERT